jgi:hypothetical protein
MNSEAVCVTLNTRRVRTFGETTPKEKAAARRDPRLDAEGREPRAA